jgi:CIC family chloride channel protein
MIVIERVRLLIVWIRNKLTRKQFIIFSSVLVGISVGLAAVVLKMFTHFIFMAASFYNEGNGKYLFLMMPVIGVFLTVVVVQNFLKGKLEKGISHIHYNVVKNSSIVPREQMYAQIITSSLTVGLGGSAGLEAPIVVTGAAFGSNYGKTYHLNYQERTLLLACGVAAGIGAVFNAPIAGVLCALEILLLDISISAFGPLIISSVVGALISKVLLQNDGILLSFESKGSFDYHHLPFYILLGLLTGLLAVYYSHVFLKTETLISKSSVNVYFKAILGGLSLSFLMIFFPTLYGEGYESIRTLFAERSEELLTSSILSSQKGNEWLVLLVIGVIILIKPIATAITLGSGGNGGNFAPSLFIGSYFGFFFSKLINLCGIWIYKLPVSNFTIVGMAGIISGIYHAPLTAIFLIAEITGGYNLMIPLMIVSSISFVLSKYMEPYSLDTIKMARNGDVFTQDKDKKILTTIDAAELIETDFQKVESNATLGTLVELISKSKRNLFPVTDNNGKLLGVISLDNIREIIFKREVYDSVMVSELMVKAPSMVFENESTDDIMKKFDETGAWNLPVVNGDELYIGFISKSRVFSSYRTTLQATTI